MITNRLGVFPFVMALLVAMLIGQAHAEEKKTKTTTVTVGEMCTFCVKRITARFDKEKDVSKVRCDIKKKSVTIYPAENVRLSPHGLWEVMESIGKTPKKMVSPEGTFTSKPKKS